ncbi:MAG: murein biosynthesis integral membrane protein MurJ [Planctomycetes bacterium]|nr:murein biosynthesis integral membrane protein MurJ [Planctomycetota bacterium]
MVKGFRQIASLTTISRVFGLIRDTAFSHFFGAGWLMTAWTMGFKIPNLARRLFGEGAAAASFIPVYTQQLHEDPQQAKKLASTVVTVIFVLLAVIAIIGELLIWGYYKFFDTNLGTQLGLTLSAVMLPYMIFICVVALLSGILQVHKHFAAPAAAPIVLNIFIITSLLLSGWLLKIPPQTQVFWVATAVILAGLAQIVIQIPPLAKAGVSIRPAWQVRSESFKKIIILMGPMILGLTVTQINTLADDLIALGLSNEQGYPLDYGAVSYLYYAQRLYQFPLGVLGISLATAIFPVMSAAAAKNDTDTLIATISKGIKAAVFVALPATAGLFLVGTILVSVIFEHGKFTPENTAVTSRTLVFYALGLSGYFAQQVTMRAFYSIQNSKLPAITALIAVFVNVVLNLILIWPMGTAGLALSTAICSYLQVIILVFMLKKQFGSIILDGLGQTLTKTIIAAVIMWIAGAILMFLMRNLPNVRFFNIIRLAVVVPVAVSVYFIAAKAMKMPEISLITGQKKSEKIAN